VRDLTEKKRSGDRRSLLGTKQYLSSPHWFNRERIEEVGKPNGLSAQTAKG
jgi:hypothetical protein